MTGAPHDRPDWLLVAERPFPSAVLVGIRGPEPVVVDPGSLTDADELPRLLEAIGPPTTVLCTHYHSDHVGAAGALQAQGAAVTAHSWDAAMVNGRDRNACGCVWLDQPVLPYRVDRVVSDGDVVTSGAVDLQVLHLPGHTLGSIGLWEPRSRTLICGDALHEHETPWIGTPHEGAGAIARAMLTLERIEQLRPSLVVSGHGAPFAGVSAAIERTRTQLQQWARDAKACAIYAAKRIFVYRLMLEPIRRDEVDAYLLTVPWLRDLASTAGEPPGAFAGELLERLAPVLSTDDGLLRTTAAHRPSRVPPPWRLADPQMWDRHA